MCLCFILVLLVIIFSSIQASEDAATVPELIQNRLIEMETKFDSFISKRNNEMETTLKALMMDHISLKTKFDKLDSEHLALKNDMANLRQQNENLEKQVFKLQNDSFRKSEKSVCKCETLIHSLIETQTQNEDFRKDDTLLEKNKPELEGKTQVREKFQNQSAPNDQSERRSFLSKSRTEQIEKRQSATVFRSSARVAFFARMSSRLTNPSDGQHIEFSDVVTNVGNAYNGASSTFVCSVAGTYVFFTSILSYENKLIETVIVRNYIELSYTFSYSGSHPVTGSNMAVVDLQENDRVWVRVFSHFHDSGDLALSSYSTFSGFILWETQ